MMMLLMNVAWSRRPICLSVTTILIATLSACDGGPTAPSSATANLVVQLTDAPVQGVEQIHLVFTTVTAKPVGGPPETLDLDVDPGESLDILALQNEVITLAAGIVDEGPYEFLMINLNESESYLIFDGDRLPLQVPSEEIKILGGFEVGANSVTTVLLDWDAAESLVLLGNGEWLLTPVITMEVSTS